MDETSGTLPKTVDPSELHQLIQALQEDVAGMKATHAEEMAKMKATHAKEMAKMKATIQKARRLGLPQDNAGSIESINATVQTLEGQLDDIFTNVGTVDIQALEGQLDEISANVGTVDIQALQAGLTAAQACCATNAASIEAVKCQLSITTDFITGSEFLVLLFANSLLLYLII